jgi:acetaldehyde dehydrogenase/alcohol dehydrogenase
VGEIPRSLEETDPSRREVEAALPDLARAAFMDASVRTNPRTPIVADLMDLMRTANGGRSP